MNDNDFLPDEALAKIEANVPNMAQGFELEVSNAWGKSAQVMFRWDKPGDVFKRAESIYALAEGAMCVDTLCKNLRAEREKIDEHHIVVPRSFVESVLYSGSFEGEDLDRLHRQAEELLS